MRNCIFFLVLSLSLCASSFAWDWSTNPGDGSMENPYQISDPNHLISIGSDPDLLDESYILTNDIVFDPDNNPDHVFDRALIAPDTDPNTNGFQGSYFTGSFDGANHKILNLVIDTLGKSDYLGLFGFVSDSPISNLGIEEGHINGKNRIGILAGYSSGSVKNCYTTGTVRADTWGGGLIGLSRADIINSYSTCSVTGTKRLGGLIGTNVTGSITNCYATGSVTGSSERIGGLVGRNYRCNIANSCATGDVEGGDWAVGGLLGFCYDSIVTRSYATGDVDGDGDVGGLVGYSTFGFNGEISNCYAAGAVTGDTTVGGLVGYNEAHVSRCYATGSVTGNTVVGCLIGFNFYQEDFADGVVSDSFWLIDSPTPGVGGNTGTVINVVEKTVRQMQTQNTFTDSPASWDFAGDNNGNNDIWRMCVDEIDYPRLSWEFAQNGDFACGDGVGFADLKALALNWLTLESDNPLIFNYACDANRDEKISTEDYAVLSKNWLLGVE